MKLALPDRSWLLFWALLTLVALGDFRARIAVPRSDTNRPVAPRALKAPASGEPAPVIVQRLSQWLPVDMQPPKTGPTADDWQLEAVYVRAGVARAILALKGPDGQITRRLRAGAGDEIEGWRVERVEARRVVLTRDGAPIEVMLFKRAAAAGGGA